MAITAVISYNNIVINFRKYNVVYNRVVDPNRIFNGFICEILYWIACSSNLSSKTVYAYTFYRKTFNNILLLLLDI